MGIRLCMLLPLLAALTVSKAQDSSRIADPKLIESFISDVDSKADRVSSKLEKQTDKVFAKWQKQEARVRKKLEKADSLKSAAVFADASQKYQQLNQRLQHDNDIKQYIPALDTLGSTLKFLQQNEKFLSITDKSKELKEAVGRVKELESSFEKAEELRKFIRERKEYLKTQLQNLGFAKELKNLSKQVYYYSEQLNEYKSLLKDHKKAERKVIELLSKTKAFQNFMRNNSMLASLFRMPGDPDDPLTQASLAGLQTRAQVNSLIQQQLSIGGPNAQQQLSANLQQAQSVVAELKSKIEKTGVGSSDAEMPEGFKPNSHKTKGFLKRLELGTNFQSTQANSYFPVTSDIGLSLGYKLNDRSILGIGASYKIGWGENIHHIKITHQGAGLRSFIDWKIKGLLWISGGFEMNYRSEFHDIDELKDLNAWQQSGLLGLSKVLSMKSKVFKKTKVMVLWDFLSYQQVPQTQPVLFRIGYNF